MYVVCANLQSIRHTNLLEPLGSSTVIGTFTFCCFRAGVCIRTSLLYHQRSFPRQVGVTNPTCPPWPPQVFVRMGLHSLALDTPKASAWANGKQSGGKTELGCLSCMIPREQLGNHKYDTTANARTNDGTLAHLDFVRSAGTAAEKAARSRDTGVVVPKNLNPVRGLTADLIRQNGVDILHGSAIVEYTRGMLIVVARCLPPSLPSLLRLKVLCVPCCVRRNMPKCGLETIKNAANVPLVFLCLCGCLPLRTRTRTSSAG